MENKIFDVVQIGYGPVGQTMAALLGKAGHRVAVFERWPAMYSLPRAATFDHEIMRIFQNIGFADRLEDKLVPFLNYMWVNAKKEVLLKVPYGGLDISGWENGYLMFQPEVEQILDEAVKTFPTVEVNQGWAAEDFVELDDCIEVTFRRGEIPAPGQWIATDETRTVRTRYLIGADGANSFTRNKLGIDSDNLGFESDFLVLDILPNNPLILSHLPEGYQVCDPKRPTTIVSRLGTKHIRFEFMLLPGETREEMLDDGKIKSLLKEWISPEQGTLIRKAVYRFSSNIAQTWQKDNIFLIGDAAHVTPPFMGQGMCTGIRDAKNLAWKLDLVLRDKAEQSLLDSYTQERYEHCKTLVQMAIQLGKIICIPDEKEAEARDQAFISGNVPPLPDMPILTDGILHTDVNGEFVSPVGELSLQGFVKYEDKVGRFDDVVAQGWTIISTKADPRSVLSDHQVSKLEQVGMNFVHVSQEDNDNAVYDVNGKYEEYFSNRGLEAVIVRPDFYNFAAVPTLQELSGAVDDLLTKLHIKSYETLV